MCSWNDLPKPICDISHMKMKASLGGTAISPSTEKAAIAMTMKWKENHEIFLPSSEKVSVYLKRYLHFNNNELCADDACHRANATMDALMLLTSYQSRNFFFLSSCFLSFNSNAYTFVGWIMKKKKNSNAKIESNAKMNIDGDSMSRCRCESIENEAMCCNVQQ